MEGRHGQTVTDRIPRRVLSRHEPGEARMVAIYLGRQLGGHKHEEIGKTVGLGKASSVSSAYLHMKERVAKEKQLQQECGRLKKP
jgi:chromosomal replication initiation ATPase DnaA